MLECLQTENRCAMQQHVLLHDTSTHVLGGAMLMEISLLVTPL